MKNLDKVAALKTAGVYLALGAYVGSMFIWPIIVAITVGGLFVGVILWLMWLNIQDLYNGFKSDK